MRHGQCWYYYQAYKCNQCGHRFTTKDIFGQSVVSFKAKITFEYLLNRSLRKVKTSKSVGKISKDKILSIVISVSSLLPEILKLNQFLEISFSGRFALDAIFINIQGVSFAILLCSDFESLDVVDYEIAKQENYFFWFRFLLKIKPILTKSNLLKFFVSDGKRGLHQAIFEIFPETPVQLCLSHKLRRIYQIVPHIRGDGYDRLFSRLATLAINAPTKELFKTYLNILLQFKHSDEFLTYPEPRQEKLKKIIGTLRFQQSKLHTRYDFPELIGNDITTNHLEGINSFLKERINLMKGFKKKENAIQLIKLLIYYYRFHKFTSSKFPWRNKRSPISLNQTINRQKLNKITNGKQPYSWIRNLLKSP